MTYGTVNADAIVDSNGAVFSPSSSLFKNRLINGDMRIDQRNAGASVTPTAGQYLVDRWRADLSASSKYSAQQNSGSVTPPVGFTNYQGVTSLSSYSVSTGDYFAILQAIEGYNINDLAWGTANAATVTLSFWVRSSLTGTFGGALSGGQTYPFTYTISSANTWEQKFITIAGSTSGTWNKTNTVGVNVIFGLGAGATYSGTAGSWSNTFYYTATGATSVVGTSGATFYITGVQLEKGSTATSFDYRPIGTEANLCLRYYQLNGASAGWSQSTTSINAVAFTFAVAMRATPTLTLINGTNAVVDPAVAFRNLSSPTIAGANGNGGYLDGIVSATTANKLQTLLPSSVSFSAEL
jgi:hypothetical protein